MKYIAFLEENYIWVIAVIIVLAMTLIGYFVDKGNLLKKKKKKKIEIDDFVKDAHEEIFDKIKQGDLNEEAEEPKKEYSDIIKTDQVNEKNQLTNLERKEDTEQFKESKEEKATESKIQEEPSYDKEIMDEKKETQDILIDNKKEELPDYLTGEESDKLYSIKDDENEVENNDTQDMTTMYDLERKSEESLDKPTENLVENEPSEEELEEEAVEMELPNLDDIKLQMPEEDEDVWKF